MAQVKIKKLDPNATIPTSGSAFAAGYDLYACLSGDGEVDIFDAGLMIQYCNGLRELTGEQLAAADLNGDGFPALIANVPDFTVGTNYWMFFDVFNGEFVSLGYMEVDGQAEEEGFFVTDAGVLYYLDRLDNSQFVIYRVDQKADGSLDLKLVEDDTSYDETFTGDPVASYLNSVGAHKLDTYYKQGGVPESFRNIKLLALYPKDTATRAEISTMLMRYLTK